MTVLLPQQPVTAKGDLPSRDLVEIIQRLSREIAAGGGGSVAWGDLTGVPATFPPDAHTHPQSDVTGLQAALDAKMDATTTLDAIPAPVASVDFAQQQALNFVIENRTSDPGSPVSGQVWLRVDL